jgi:hypothetical protein
VREANQVEFSSSRVQDELLVTSDFFLPVVLRRRRLGIQDHRVSDVLGDEWVVTRRDGMGGIPVHALEVKRDSWRDGRSWRAAF